MWSCLGTQHTPTGQAGGRPIVPQKSFASGPSASTGFFVSSDVHLRHGELRHNVIGVRYPLVALTLSIHSFYSAVARAYALD